MRQRVLTAFILLAMLSVASLSAQTFLRQITAEEPHGYSFSLNGPATTSLTVMWNRITADMVVEVHCQGEFEPELWRRGRSVSTHDRMMRLDVGMEGNDYCEVYVWTSADCAYAINFAWQGQLTLTPTAISFAHTCEGEKCGLSDSLDEP